MSDYFKEILWDGWEGFKNGYIYYLACHKSRAFICYKKQNLDSCQLSQIKNMFSKHLYLHNWARIHNHVSIREDLILNLVL